VYQKVSRLSHKKVNNNNNNNNNNRSEATQRVVAAKLIRLTHKTAMQLHLVAENCTICSSRSRWPVRKLFEYTLVCVVLVNLNVLNLNLSLAIFVSLAIFEGKEMKGSYTNAVLL
jgi:hypothetical protein